MSRKYYTLAVKSFCDNKWSPEFGDYDRSVVGDELDDFRSNYPANRLKVIVSGDSQAEINRAIAALNPKCRGCDNPPLPGCDVCQACGEEGYSLM